jgi:hypothetical protein
MQKIDDAQQNVAMHRHMLRQQRAELGRKLGRAVDLGTELADRLNGLVPELQMHLDSSQLCAAVIEAVQLIGEFHTSRDDYQVQEMTYFEDEDQLDGEEFILKEAQNDFRRRLERVPTSQLTALFGDYNEWSIKLGGAESSPDVRQQDHPLVYEYQSRLEEAESLRESLWENNVERETLRQWQETHLQHGLPVWDDTLAAVRDYERIEKDMLDELAQIDMDIQRLKLECDALGLDVDAEPALYPDGLDKESSVAGSFTAYDLLKPWRDQKPSYFERIPEVQDRVSTAQFIDKWLLDQLCQSSFQVLLRKNVDNDEQDDESFRQMVLGAWTTDHAVDVMSKHVTRDKSSRAMGVSEGDDIEDGEDPDQRNTMPANEEHREPPVETQRSSDTLPSKAADSGAESDRSLDLGVQGNPDISFGNPPGTTQETNENHIQKETDLTAPTIGSRGQKGAAGVIGTQPQEARVRESKKPKRGLRSVVAWPGMSARRISQTLWGGSKHRLLDGNRQKSVTT